MRIRIELIERVAGEPIHDYEYAALTLEGEEGASQTEPGREAMVFLALTHFLDCFRMALPASVGESVRIDALPSTLDMTLTRLADDQIRVTSRKTAIETLSITALANTLLRTAEEFMAMARPHGLQPDADASHDLQTSIDEFKAVFRPL